MEDGEKTVNKGRGRQIKLVVVGTALLLVAVMGACKSQKPTRNAVPIPTPDATPAESASPTAAIEGASESKPLDTDKRFDHTRTEHKKQSCNLCHIRFAGDGKPDAQPSLPKHPACYACHSKDFTSPPNKNLCIVCHKVPVDASATQVSFPKNQIQFGLKSFSHGEHMDASKMPKGNPLPKCADCHQFGGEMIAASFPKHPACYSCHTPQAEEKLSGCQVCHANQTVALKFREGVGPATTVYNFKHGSHLKQASINESCEKCHKLIGPFPDQPRSDILQMNISRGQHHTSACWSCHVQAKENTCTKCHLGGPPL